MQLKTTNAVLRYLLMDNPDMFKTVKESIINGDCYLYPEVMAEAVYVLKGVYGVERKDIAEALSRFLEEVNSEKKEAMARGLAVFEETSLDFVDCLLIAYKECYGCQILTFDKKMLKRLSRG